MSKLPSTVKFIFVEGPFNDAELYLPYSDAQNLTGNGDVIFVEYSGGVKAGYVLHEKPKPDEDCYCWFLELDS